MNEELKSLIENAAKLRGIGFNPENDIEYLLCHFNPLDPERGDLMRVVEAAELFINWKACWVAGPTGATSDFTKDNYQSLALAILRAASTVYKSRGD